MQLSPRSLFRVGVKQNSWRGLLQIVWATVFGLSGGLVTTATGAIIFTAAAQAADPAVARIRVNDFAKIKNAYNSAAGTARLQKLKLPPLELHSWFGCRVEVLSTHDVNRKKDVYHAYKVFIWQNIGDQAYLVMGGKKLGRHEKLFTYNACAKRKIKELKYFKDNQFRNREPCQMISVLAFEEYNCKAEAYCKKNLKLNRHRKSNKYLLLYSLR